MKHNVASWKKEHYDLMYSSKNCDDCCAEFQKRFPEIKLSSVFTHWNHKNTYKKEYEKLCNPPIVVKKPVVVSDMVPHNGDDVQSSAIRLRNVILSMNLKDGVSIPWEDVLKRSEYKTVGTIRAVISGYGVYGKKKTNKYFTDIVSTDASSGAKIFVSPKDETKQPVSPSVIMVPATIKHKYDKIKEAPQFVDEERLKVSEHNMRAEQTQILKEILSAIRENTELMTTTMARFDAAVDATKKKTVNV